MKTQQIIKRTLLVGLTTLSPLQSMAKQELPNFVIILTDDQGWGDAGYNGHPVIKTPELDEMAGAGIRFDRFYATASVCSPSRASALTGRNNFRLGISSPLNKGWHLSEKEITIPEALKTKGYVSGHFGKWHVGAFTDERDPGHKMTPGMAGFDVWFSTPNVLPTYDPYKKGYKEGKYVMYWDNGRNITREEGVKDPALRGDDATIMTNKAIEFMTKQVKADKPFFTFICLHNVHTPMGVIPDLAEKFYPNLEEGLTYSTNVSAISRQVGVVRSELRKLGVADNTMLWFASDNGPNLKGKKSIKYGKAQGGKFNYTPIGSTGAYRGFKRDLYEGGVRVPGLVEWPAKIKKPFATEYAAVISDWLPTLLDAAGIPLPTDRPYDGISLLPMMTGEKKERGESIGFHCQGWDAWSADRYKIVKAGKKAEWELYDLKNDPFEEKDIIKQMPEVAKQMLGEWQKWADSCSSELIAKGKLKK